VYEMLSEVARVLKNHAGQATFVYCQEREGLNGTCIEGGHFEFWLERLGASRARLVRETLLSLGVADNNIDVSVAVSPYAFRPYFQLLSVGCASDQQTPLEEAIASLGPSFSPARGRQQATVAARASPTPPTTPSPKQLLPGALRDEAHGTPQRTANRNLLGEFEERPAIFHGSEPASPSRSPWQAKLAVLQGAVEQAAYHDSRLAAREAFARVFSPTVDTVVHKDGRYRAPPPPPQLPGDPERMRLEALCTDLVLAVDQDMHGQDSHGAARLAKRIGALAPRGDRRSLEVLCYALTHAKHSAVRTEASNAVANIAVSGQYHYLGR